jgi:hypothetical protein
VVGIATSGIPSTALEEGRSATITGIVKRAYPTASDQRFALVPRFAADIDLGPAPRTGSDDPRPGDSAGDSSDGPAPGLIDARLEQLPTLVGWNVRVGGTLVSVEEAVLTLDDGTGTGSARIEDDVAIISPPLRPGEVLNLTGRVMAMPDGVIIATRAREVIRAAALEASAGSEPQPTGAIATLDPATAPADSVGDDSGTATRLGLALAVACLAAFAAVAGGALVFRSSRRERGRNGDPRVADGGPGPTGPA